MSRGGMRKGAGRPKGKEPTKAIRLPISIISQIENFMSLGNRAAAYEAYKLPLYTSKVAAGFPSPAEDYISDRLDLNEYLVKHPAATFLVRAIGDSMINAGIHDNDILIVDRSLTPVPGRIVIVAIDGLLTVKRLHKNASGKFILLPENPRYSPIEVHEGQDTYIWGVVTQVLHSV